MTREEFEKLVDDFEDATRMRALTADRPRSYSINLRGCPRTSSDRPSRTNRRVGGEGEMRQCAQCRKKLLED